MAGSWLVGAQAWLRFGSRRLTFGSGWLRLAQVWLTGSIWDSTFTQYAPRFAVFFCEYQTLTGNRFPLMMLLIVCRYKGIILVD